MDLDRVVLEACTDDAYQYGKCDENVRVALAGVQLRTGAVISAFGVTYRVLSTSPSSREVISAGTTVLVLPPAPEQKAGGTSESIEPRAETDVGASSPFGRSLFSASSSSFVSNKAPVVKVCGALLDPPARTSPRDAAGPGNLLSTLCERCYSRVVCTSALVLHRLGIMSGSWVLLKHNERQVVAQIVSLPVEWERRDTGNAPHPMAYCSANIFSLLRLPAPRPLTVLSGVSSCSSPSLEISSLVATLREGRGGVEAPIDVARRISIARVRQPDSPMLFNSDVDLALDAETASLRAYISTEPSRVLRKGEVFAVPQLSNCSRLHRQPRPLRTRDAGHGGLGANLDEAEWRCEEPWLSNCSAIVYYQVVEIERDDGVERFDGDMMVVKDHTEVIEKAPVRARLAPFSYSYFTKGCFPAQFLTKCGFPAYRCSSSELQVIENIVPLFASSLLLCGSPNASQVFRGSGILLHGPARCGKRFMIKCAADALGLHVAEINALDLVAQTETATSSLVREAFTQAAGLAPCVLIIRAVDMLFQSDHQLQRLQKEYENVVCTALAEAQGMCGSEQFPVCLVGTVDDCDKLSGHVRSSCFRHEIEMKSLDQRDRLLLLKRFTETVAVDMTVSLLDVATATAGFVAGDLEEVVCKAHAQCTDGVIMQEDIDKAISFMQKQQTADMGAPKIPNVKWEDVGGLAHAKKDILDTIELPLKNPELFSGSSLKARSGVLLYGPPGTGKTLLAKAVATECALNFYSVKGPELINMYVGESEKNIRDVFKKARQAEPCVIFFDELDSLAPARGHGSDSGGVMDRVVSQLLAELDGLQSSAKVFVIGATNRPDLLDPALLRPGRLDRLIYLGVSNDRVGQRKILNALTRKFTLSADVDFESVLDVCPLTFTGADFYAVCSDAMLSAIKDRIQSGDEDGSSGVVVNQRHFLESAQSITPSITQRDLEKYERLRREYSTV